MLAGCPSASTSAFSPSFVFSSAEEDDDDDEDDELDDEPTTTPPALPPSPWPCSYARRLAFSPSSRLSVSINCLYRSDGTRTTFVVIQRLLSLTSQSFKSFASWSPVMVGGRATACSSSSPEPEPDSEPDSSSGGGGGGMVLYRIKPTLIYCNSKISQRIDIIKQYFLLM